MFLLGILVLGDDLLLLDAVNVGVALLFFEVLIAGDSLLIFSAVVLGVLVVRVTLFLLRVIVFGVGC